MIGQNTFELCSNLTSINIGNSVTTIRSSAFYYCYNLTSIISLANTPPRINYDTFGKVPTSTCTLKVPKESVAAYKAAEYWNDFNIVEQTEATDFSDVYYEEHCKLVLNFLAMSQNSKPENANFTLDNDTK